MLKKIILFLALVTGIAGNTLAQEKKSDWQIDKLRIGTGGSFGYLPITMKTLSESQEQAGVFEMQETNGALHHILLQAEVVVPFYRTDFWSVGAKFGAAFGLQGASEEADGLNGNIIYDFPQFLYYRNYATTLDFSVLAGYKYTKSPLTTHFALAGIEVQATNTVSVRAYGALNSYSYHQMHADGKEESIFEIREFGLSLIHSF